MRYVTPAFLCLLSAVFVFGQVGCEPSPPPGKVEESSTPETEPTATGDSASESSDDEQPKAEATSATEPTETDETAEPSVTEKPADATTEKPVEPLPTAEIAEEKTALPDVAPVLLGTSELTSGIPGEGPLTEERIKAWLEDENNHKVLNVTLPLGLSAGQAAIVGLDKSPLTRAKIELGRQLYFDRRLSADASVSCADCHHPDTGFARDTRFGVGIGGQEGNRNSPASYNRILSGPQFWDGRAASLEEQAKGPIANPIEMGNTHEVCVRTISDIPGYKMQFAKIYGDTGNLHIDNIANAIAAFERTLVTNPSPYDYYEPLRVFEEAFGDDLEDLEAFKEDDEESYDQYIKLKEASDAHPMSESAKRGREIFFTQKGRCTACHVGPNFTDEKYHNIGVGMDADEPDLGRFVVTGEEKDRGAFKTPTIRNVALTAPYMHDGSQKTLEEVVEWYNKGGHPNPQLSQDVRKLNLTDQEKKDLVEFMKALTGEFTPVETGQLPEGT